MDMDIKNMTVEQFIEMKKKMDEAENDTTPYAITDDDNNVLVVGDVSKTETKTHDYTIIFYYPNRPAFRERLEKEGVDIIKETPNYLIFKRTYEDVWVPPRTYTAVQTSFVEVYRYFNVITENGELRDLTPDEIIEAMKLLDDEMIERMVHAVATVLRIPREEEECIYSLAIPEVMTQMIVDFPEIINSVDFFTETSSDRNTERLTVVEGK